MSGTNNVNSNNQEKKASDRCIICLNSFGVQDERVPYICINPKCNQRFCFQCINHIRIYNGSDRLFRCMYCLKEYKEKEEPKKDELLLKQIWEEADIKYGIHRTKHLLSNECNVIDLINDIDRRQRQLANLISAYHGFSVQISSHQQRTVAENMSNELLSILRGMRTNQNLNMKDYKSLYRDKISASNDENIGLHYIRHCERLTYEISELEQRQLFPKTVEKQDQWTPKQESSKKYEPKIIDLTKAIEEDLKAQFSNSHLTPRTKIGLIGYTNAGKSTLLNRLLDVKALNDNGAAPVSTDKTTHFPLIFNRKEPLIHPVDKTKSTEVTLIDLPGQDRNRPAVNDQVEAGNYLDEIRKADCDIYILVFDEELRDEQKHWIEFIEEQLRRKCVLVRSKVDLFYLLKFRERSGTFFSRSTPEQRNNLNGDILKDIRSNSALQSRKIYLVATNYTPESVDAESLLEQHSFDLPDLLKDLGCLAFNARVQRIYVLAIQLVALIINTCFRRSYIVDVLKYQIVAGVVAIVPFLDQLPRYCSRENIRKAFGIDATFLEYLKQNHVVVSNYKRQTSVFKDFIEVDQPKIDPATVHRLLGTVTANTLATTSTVTGEIITVAAPATAITSNTVRVAPIMVATQDTLVAGSVTADVMTGVAAPTTTIGFTTARVVLTGALLCVSVVLAAGVGAWSAISSKKHIFSYTNRVCDDLIQVIGALILSIIDREQANGSD